jgi:hypothetical protein
VFKIDTKEDALVLVVDDIQNSQFQLPSTSITERCKTIRSIYLAVKRWDVDTLSGTLKASAIMKSKLLLNYESWKVDADPSSFWNKRNLCQ